MLNKPLWWFHHTNTCIASIYKCLVGTATVWESTGFTLLNLVLYVDEIQWEEVLCCWCHRYVGEKKVGNGYVQAFSKPLCHIQSPQGFLTAMRQETTRMNLAKGWELDSVVLHNEVTKMMKEDVAGPPPADIGGVYIYGLFLEGAGWDRRNSKLVESAPKVRTDWASLTGVQYGVLGEHQKVFGVPAALVSQHVLRGIK